MKKLVFIPLVSLILNTFFLTEVQAQNGGTQVDVAAVYQQALPKIKKIRRLLRKENTFDAKIYRQLNNGLKRGKYKQVSNILKHIENIGGNKVDAEIEKLRTFLGGQGIVLFQNAQKGGDPLVAKTPVSIHWTGYVGGNRASIGQVPVISAPTLNPATATASYAAVPSTVCTVDAKTGALTIVGKGNCKITLTATPGDPSTHTQTKASLIVTIGPGVQTVSSGNPYGSGTPVLLIKGFLALQNVPTGGVATLEYQTTSSGVCTVGATSGDVTADAAGSCVVQARWSASSDYNASPWTTIHTFTIDQGNQAAPTGNNIYGASPRLTVGDTLAVATNPSGNGHGSLEYQSGDTAICTVSDTNGTVTGKKVGPCAVKVRWRGDANYHPSPWHDILSITLTLPIIPVTIEWTGYAGGNIAKVGQSPALSNPTLNPATASASFSATPASICSVNPTTGALTIKGTGNCEVTLTATPADSSTHSVATASVTVAVGLGAQTLNPPHLPYYYGSYAESALKVGKLLTLRKVPTGGHTSLEYKSTNPGVCTVYSNSGHVYGNTTGRCSVQARWVGSSQYSASPWTTIHTFDVGKGTQAAPTGNNIYGNAPALAAGNTLSVATAPSGGGGHGTLEYQSTTTSVCTVGGSTGVVTAKAVGACSARVRWRGNGNYNSSPWHDILSLTVSIGTQSDPTATDPYGKVPSVAVDATLDIARPPSGGHGTLEYQSVDTGSCTVDAQGSVTGVSSAGNCTIQARWTGNDSFTATSWATIATVTITETKQPGQGQYRLGEFGIYDSDDNLVIKTGALDTPKRLAYIFDNPQKLFRWHNNISMVENFTADEKAYLQSKYNWTEDLSPTSPHAPPVVLRIVDLRQYPRYGNEPAPKARNTHPFVVLVDNIIVDFVGFKVRTTPSQTRKQAIDKMFAWLVSPTPGVPRDRIIPRGGSATGFLKACLDQNNTRLALSPINPAFSDDSSQLNPMRPGDTPSIDLARDMKTYLNSENPYANFYFVRAAELLRGRYQKFRSHLKDPEYNVANIKKTRSCQNKDKDACCYDEEKKALKPLYNAIKYAFDYQTLQAILKDATTDADVLDMMTGLVTTEAGKTEEDRLSETHDTVSFNFNFRDPSRGYVPDKNVCYNPQNGPRTNVPYSKRWLLGILQRHVRQFSYARDWILSTIEWADRIEREYNYALWRRRPLIDYATHDKGAELSVMWSSGYCFPVNDFKATDKNGKNVVDIALGERQKNGYFRASRWGLADEIAVWNNIYRYMGEDLPRRSVPWM